MLHSGVKVCKGCVEPSHKLFPSSICLYLGLGATSIPWGPCHFKASKFTSRSMIGQYQPATGNCSGLNVTLGLESCSGGSIRYCLGPNTLLGIQGCPSQWWMSGQVSLFKIFIINSIFLLICSSSGLPHSPETTHCWQHIESPCSPDLGRPK